MSNKIKALFQVEPKKSLIKYKHFYIFLKWIITKISKEVLKTLFNDDCESNFLLAKVPFLCLLAKPKDLAI